VINELSYDTQFQRFRPYLQDSCGYSFGGNHCGYGQLLQLYGGEALPAEFPEVEICCKTLDKKEGSYLREKS